MESKQINPIQDLFVDIKKILDFIEVKDLNQAMQYETSDIRDDAEMWLGAVTENDSYVTYKNYWTISMFQEIIPNVKFINIETWMKNPNNVPLQFRDNLLKRGRESFLRTYVERNTYYRMLNGLPPIDTSRSDFIYLSEPLRNQLHADENIPVHELPSLIQNRYISTNEYQQILLNNPDKRYLKYLGIYKIDSFTARRARDFELIRYFPLNRSDINPNLLKEFGELYSQYRDYVMLTLYNRSFENVYENYRTFMGVLIMSFTLMQISNKAVESVSNRRFLDDNILHILLSMYGIPDSLLMTQEVRRNLVINLLNLTREKGTDQVYYDLIQILGYQDIIIYKLMLMRGQTFDDQNGQTTLDNGESIDTFEDIKNVITVDKNTGEPIKTLDVDPYFVAVDLKNENPYDAIVDGEATVYDYKKVTDPDPTWWDLDDTQKILKNTNYSIADSKYIVVEAVIHQIQYLFESIYFPRLVIDNKEYTDTFTISLPDIFGLEEISVYDIMVFILAATCMNNGVSGEIITRDHGMFITAGFNFDIDIDLFQTYLNNSRYLDKDRIMKFMSNLSMKTPSDINRLFNDVLYPMREWLESKMAQSINRHEFIEYENIYRALFTYDASRNTFLEDYKIPIEIIKERYNITDYEMLAYQHFYPRTYSGDAITVDEFQDSRYYPFLYNNPIVWNINIPFKGVLYLHDILNAKDIRDLKAEDGTYIFIDDFNEIDREAVADAISAINGLRDDELKDAVFRIDTPVLNTGGEKFRAGDRLPSNIRGGVFKQILIDKIRMDANGLANPPTTYLEYLYRKNEKLYHLLVDGDRFIHNKEEWLEDVMNIVLALETDLNLHMKYFEQSIVGSELFFKPLISLIQHFKSTFIRITGTGLKYVFGDKVDTGGNSNMLKIFDEIKLIIHFVILSQRGHPSTLGLYDTEHRLKYHILMRDRSQMIRQSTQGTVVENRKSWMGSIRMVDEMIFKKNGKPVDPSDHPSSWYAGEHGVGRWSDEENILMRVRTGVGVVNNLPVDTEGWKNFVESYNP